MYHLSESNSFFRIVDVLVGQILQVYVTTDAVIQANAYSGRLSGTAARVEMIPYLLVNQYRRKKSNV